MEVRTREDARAYIESQISLRRGQRPVTNDQPPSYCLSPIHRSETTMEFPGFCGS